MISLMRISRGPATKSQLPVLSEILVQQRRGNKTTYSHTLKYGEGGRLSYNGNVVTVFGATGFLGRYVVGQLAKTGTQLIIPFASAEDDVRDLRVAGDLGQIKFMRYSLLDYESILDTMTHSNAAINLVGKNYETLHHTFEGVLTEAAGNIAKAASECDVQSLIHVSHINADIDSPSRFMKAKAAGEERVLAEFPNATIMRPTDAVGDEDKYFNKFAYMRRSSRRAGVVPLARGGWDVYKQPIFIRDLAAGIVAATFDEKLQGKLYELYGPQQYTLREIVEFVFRVMQDDLNVISVNQTLYQQAGRVIELLTRFFHPKVSKDSVIRENLSEIPTPGALSLADLGVEATDINLPACNILRRHRHPDFMYSIIKEADYIKPHKLAIA